MVSSLLNFLKQRTCVDCSNAQRFEMDSTLRKITTLIFLQFANLLNDTWKYTCIWLYQRKRITDRTWFIVLTVFDFNEQDYSLTLDRFQGNASWFLACKLITDGSMFNFRWYFMMQNHLPLNSRLLILGRSLGFIYLFFSLSVSPIPGGFFFWIGFGFPIF
jgi:hypothetical protein